MHQRHQDGGAPWRPGRPADRVGPQQPARSATPAASHCSWCRCRCSRRGGRDYRTIDGQRAADITLKTCQVPASALLGAEGRRLGNAGCGLPTMAPRCCARKRMGAMDALNASTLEYLKTRQQFGVPIGRFQALQHRMAEMFIQYWSRRARWRCWRRSKWPRAMRRNGVAWCRRPRCGWGRRPRFVGQQAVQLHGGMGVTDELPAAHYFKRLTMIEIDAGRCAASP
jgi:alkylation response protein AidB-like acyl-CoA dehydrogenase